MRVSHETIYRTLFVQARGALRQELTACLRTGRTQRRAHKRTEHSGTGRVRDMVPISARQPPPVRSEEPWSGSVYCTVDPFAVSAEARVSVHRP
jgi:IS30 family transposase